MENAILIQDFIEQIWNNKAFEKISDFLHDDYKDHSLPPILSNDKNGTIKWVINTSASFENTTLIEDQITEGDKSVIKIKMILKHIGNWRDIEPTGIELQTYGYRYFKIKDGKIIEQWALIDGQIIENQIKEASHGCKISV